MVKLSGVESNRLAVSLYDVTLIFFVTSAQAGGQYARTIYKDRNIYMNKKKGQATLESILLLVILVSLTIFIIQETMRGGEWMKKIIDAPGNHIRGMSIAGVWKKCKNPPIPPSSTGGCSAMDEHPNQEVNTLQVEGEDSR